MDQTDQIVAELQQIGLPEKEARVYLASLELGEATAQQIAVRAIVNRPTTYVLIESLAKRGLMSSVIRGKKRYFAAEPPEKIETFISKREAEIRSQKNAAAKLINLIKKEMGGETPIVKVFTNKDGIKNLIEDIDKSSPTTLFELTDLDAMSRLLTPDDLRLFRLKLGRTVKNGTAIFFGDTEKIKEKNQVLAKQMPTNYVKKIRIPSKFGPFEANIGIYGNKISMISFRDKMHSVIIESRPLKKALTILFKLAEEGLKK